jgi:hypothetical protein
VLHLRSTTNDGSVAETELPLDEGALAAAAQAGGFWSYAAGVSYVMSTQFIVGGLSVDNYRTTLPLKKGLSSSAALCVLLARAFNRCYALGLTPRGEMQAAYEGERLTPSQCGRMDQAVAFGQVPVVMRFAGDVMSVAPAQLGAALHLVLVDLRAAKDTVAILSALQAAFPHPRADQDRSLAALLGPINQRITAEAAAAMAGGDVEALGGLMLEAQREFDARAGPLCPAHLGRGGSPALHRALEHPAIQGLIWGGKGLGSQGDGSAQLLCKGAQAQAAVCEILEADLGVRCMSFTLQPTGASAAAAAAARDERAIAQAAARLTQLRRDVQQAREEYDRLTT